MEEKYYTLKDLAKMFDVTVQGLHKEINKSEYQNHIKKRLINHHQTTTVDNQGLSLLKEHFKHSNTQTSCINSKQVDATNKNNLNKVDDKIKINALQVELTSKNELVDSLKSQINNLRKNIDQLHTELQHEQELHLADQQHVKQLTDEVNSLKLKQPNSKVDETSQKLNQQEESTTNKLNKKHWWQFWK